MRHIPITAQKGLTLVELMVAITIGMIILLAMSIIYSNNSATRYEIERNSRQLENGRYALQVLTDDIRLAGFLGEYYTTTPPASLPANPCSTALADIQASFALHLQGYDDDNGGLACLSDYKADSDVIVVRRAATCTSANPAAAGCDAVSAGLPYIQVSGCSTDASAFGLAVDTTTLTLTKIDCTTVASQRRFLTHIYYIANNNLPGDGIPTLKRWELGGTNNPVPLVAGIENLQFEYGVDSDNNGAPNSYTSDPASVGNWYNVTTVAISLLSRNDSISPGYTDSKTYKLLNHPDLTFGDAYKRHVYSSTVILDNPAGRRQ